MQTRAQSIDDFLARSGWVGARRAPLAGDASFRRYERVYAEGRQAVLMDAPPEKENVGAFVQVGTHLLAKGLSAPELYAEDLTNGFLLLEDLGDDLFSRVLRDARAQEEALYLAAADVLAALHACAGNEGFPVYDAPLLLRETDLFAEWFLPAVMSENAASLAREFRALWRELMARMPALPPVLVLRDFHADNLLWLPGREGVKRVGLLDFQDGVIGSPAYDLVSFLEDARRDVSTHTVESVLAHYLRLTRLDRERFMAAYAFFGAQRNCKIVGIFTRLAVRDGKRQYLNYLPRVWGHLARDLQHPLLAPLAEWMERAVPGEWRGVPMLKGDAA